MIIPRLLKKEILNKLKNNNKAIILYGPRQVGKTTLIKEIINELPYKTLEINADQQKFHDILSSRDLQKISNLISNYELIFIDEAQRIRDIGINLKLITDNFKDTKIIVTGSSTLSLANHLTEPLTGRKWVYTLFPIAYSELNSIYNNFELNDQLEQRLVWGSYPEIINIQSYQDRKKYLNLLTTDYLYKDVLELVNIKNSDKIYKLLQLLAFQIGSTISLSELANNLGMSKQTVEHYIDLLEKSFVLFRLAGFSRNLRKEIAKNDKIYFYDLGIRNVLINNLNELPNRNDIGQLWENFLMIERKKRNEYTIELPASYFWRTYTGAEIDYIEEDGGELKGFEFKYKNKNTKPPKTWLTTYNNASFEVITLENYLKFII